MAILNALRIDETSGDISIPAGASGYFRVDIEDVELVPGEDKAVFCVGNRDAKVIEPVMVKNLDIIKDDDGQYVSIELANADTRGLEPGTYRWNITLVQDPAYDEDGNIITDERADGVYPLFYGKSQPKFVVEGVVNVI